MKTNRQISLTCLWMTAIAFVLTVSLLFAQTAYAKSDTVTENAELGKTYSRVLSDDAEEYDFVYTIPASGRLTVTIHNDTDKVRFHVYESDEKVNKDLHDLVEKGDHVFVYDFAPGTIELRVERFLIKNSGNFSISTSFKESGETYTAYNNTINAVRDSEGVPFNTRIMGQLACNDECDYYKVKLERSGKLIIDLHSDIEKVELELTDEDIVNKSYKPERGDADYGFDLAAGTYFVKLARCSSLKDDQIINYLKGDYLTGDYSFVLRFVSSGETCTAPNNSFNAVRGRASIPLGRKITGQIALNDRCDYYKVRIPKKGKYTVKVISSVPSMHLAAYKGNEDSYASSSYYHDKGTNSYTFTLNKGVNFLLFEKVSASSGTGNYKFIIRPAGTKLKSLKSPAKKQIAVTWNKSTGNGYEIQYSTNRKFKKNSRTIRIKSGSKTRKTIKGLKSSKRYYVRVRCYVNSNGKRVYSGWSGLKAVTVK